MITIGSTKNVFVTSDHHFGHANILGFTNRPYPTIDEMNADYVKRWNSKVKDGDTVFHLGDFTLSDIRTASKYFDLLNGHIFMLGLPWHHDKRWLPYSNNIKNLTVLQALEVVVIPQQGYPHPFKITLSHYPMASWEASYYGMPHFHGHTHSNNKITAPHAVNVCVDAWNGYPVPLNTLLEIAL